MPQYALARHVFVCMQGEHVVFLDVRKDRYFALEASRAAGLGELVEGWPVPARATVDHVQHGASSVAPAAIERFDRGTLSAVVALLLEKGILTSDLSNGKAATPTHAQSISGDLTADALDEPPRIGVVAILRFLHAAIVAALLLRLRALEYVVERAKLRRARRHGKQPSVDVAVLHEVVGAFATLRPFFFTAKDACLFDAVALSEFLSGYGVFPQWVFGVQARPFAAHCWLQDEGVVLNDTSEHVRRYTPIMVA
jgi:hypothetical protein